MTPENASEWKILHAAKQETLDWFRHSRYGMFIHWGLYSQLGGVYEGKRMEEGRRPRVAEWIMHAFNIPREAYRAYANSFDPDHFDPAAWVSLAKAAGMQYMVLTSKHHEGFALFDSQVSGFNSVQAAPCKRDFVQELYDECEKQGMPFGLYYSHSIDWMDGGDGGNKDYRPADNVGGFHAYNEWDPAPVSFEEYLDRKALPQVRELLTRFPNLKLLWFDVPYFIPDERSFEFYKTVSELSPDTLVCDRVGNDYGDYLIPGDNEIPAVGEIENKAWETVGTMNNSWGYRSYDHDWKSPVEVLFWILDIISKDGNYMLNIGPRADGIVPEESVRILKEVGAWLDRNREAVYCTQARQIPKEGPTQVIIKGTSSREETGFQGQFTQEDFWFTCTDENVFAFSMCASLPDRLTLTTIDPDTVKAVHHLGSGMEIPFQASEDNLILDTTEVSEADLAHVFRIR